ncbi:MAG: 2-isopropylmalate synthase, partial [Pseudomonadota bacterium]
GEIEGEGVATYANGDVYEGSFVAGRRQGPGTMRYATGQVESGEWAAGSLTERAVEEVTPTADEAVVPAETESDG